jgi:hypothetical protein
MIHLLSEQFAKIKYGNQFNCISNYAINTKLRAYYDNKFLGLVEVISPTIIKPTRLIQFQ